MSVSVLVKNACETTGEGPYWEESTSSLLYVDILNGGVHRWSAIAGEDSVHHFNDSVSFIVPRSVGGGYVIGLGRTVAALDWDSAKTEPICEVDIGTKSRFNDAKCDASGRLWAGIMGIETAPGVLDKHQGSLYSMEHDHSVKKHLDNIDISNGLAWSLDSTVMYYIDTLPRKVYAFDFDLAAGSISNQRTAVDFGEGTVDTLGHPDGMCIDAEGKIWIACYGVGKVIRFDVETGAQLQTLNFPAMKTTSCCFGGPNYSELYVTSGKWGMTDEEFQTKQPLAGSVFKVTGLGVHGFAAPAYSG